MLLAQVANDVILMTSACGSMAQYPYAEPAAAPEPAVQTYVNGEPAAYGGYQYPTAENYGYTGNGDAAQAASQPELGQGTVQLNCIYANGVSGGCNGAGSVLNFACGGDPFCYCYSVRLAHR